MTFARSVGDWGPLSGGKTTSLPRICRCHGCERYGPRGVHGLGPSESVESVPPAANDARQRPRGPQRRLTLAQPPECVISWPPGTTGLVSRQGQGSGLQFSVSWAMSAARACAAGSGRLPWSRLCPCANDFVRGRNYYGCFSSLLLHFGRVHRLRWSATRRRSGCDAEFSCATGAILCHLPPPVWRRRANCPAFVPPVRLFAQNASRRKRAHGPLTSIIR